MSLANLLGSAAAAVVLSTSDPTVPFSAVTLQSQFLTVQDESGAAMQFTHLDPPLWASSGRFGAGSITGRAGFHAAAKAVDPTILNLGANDFTIECFYRASAEPNSTTLLSRWGTTGNRCWYLTYEASGNRFRFIASTDGSASTVAINYDFDVESIGLAAAFDGNWHHLAVTRSSGTIRIFLDGNLATGASSSYAIGSTALFDGGTYPFLIGATTVSNLTPSGGWENGIDEVRVTVGTARYVSNFTPPTARFGRNSTDDPNWSAVKLLAGFDTPQGLAFAGSVTPTFNMVGNGKSYEGITSDGFGRRGSVTPPYFSPDSGYLFGSGDFTVEVFGLNRPSVWSGTEQILGVRFAGAGAERSWGILYDSTAGRFQFAYSTDGTTETVVDFAGVTPAASTVYNLAVSRRGTTLHLYVNGTRVNTHTIGTATLFNASSTPLGLCCGMNAALTAAQSLSTDARLKAFRLTKGAYRYNLATYAVPTLPLPTA